MGFARGWSPASHGSRHRTAQVRREVTTNKSREETTMYGIDLDPQTTSDYWAHYLRVMKEAKTH
jgi:hypothetical protein